MVVVDHQVQFQVEMVVLVVVANLMALVEQGTLHQHHHHKEIMVVLAFLAAEAVEVVQVLLESPQVEMELHLQSLELLSPMLVVEVEHLMEAHQEELEEQVEVGKEMYIQVTMLLLDKPIQVGAAAVHGYILLRKDEVAVLVLSSSNSIRPNKY